MQIGFTVVGRGGEVEYRPFGRVDVYRALVASSCADNLAAIVLGRLDYREDLLAAVAPEITPGRTQLCRSNDAALVLAVYERLGASGLGRLEGDFALVVWDGRKNALLGL